MVVLKKTHNSCNMDVSDSETSKMFVKKLSVKKKNVFD